MVCVCVSVLRLMQIVFVWQSEKESERVCQLMLENDRMGGCKSELV